MKFIGITLFVVVLAVNIGFGQAYDVDKNYFKLTDTSFTVGQLYNDQDEMRFFLGKYDVLPYSHTFLDSIVLFLLKNDDLIVDVRQHRDSRGSNALSQNLTGRRARAVRDYLIEKGVDENRLTYKGFGETQPNIAYEQNGQFSLFKPTNGEPFEKFVLTDSYVNHFKEINMKNYEELHQMNRRTEFVIAGVR